jgi:hypothetical protein
MQAFRHLVLVAGLSLASIPSLAAGLENTQPMTAQLMLKRGNAAVITRMEYCLRNMPELTEQLVEAHAKYSQAAADATVILDREFPASRFTIQRARVQTSPGVAATYDLKQARSEGFNQACPRLIEYMSGATSGSVAKSIGDLLTSLQRQYSSP